jgi:hypothetical protein
VPRERGRVEVIHPGAAQPSVAQHEAAGLDDVDCHAETGAEPDQRAGILRNIWLEEGEAHTGDHSACGAGRRGGQSGFATAAGCIIPLTNFLPVTIGPWKRAPARTMRQDVA